MQAITDLKEAAPKNNEFVGGAADQIVKLTDEHVIFVYKRDDELMTHAISALKTMKYGANKLSQLAGIEKQRTDSTTPTHEDEIIAAILEIGGQDAVEALGGTVGIYYPEKAAIALESLDTSNTVKELHNITYVSLSYPLKPCYAQSLHSFWPHCTRRSYPEILKTSGKTLFARQ